MQHIDPSLRTLLIELLHVSKIKRPEGMVRRNLALIDELQIKIGIPFGRNEREISKDGTIFKGLVQTVEYDEVWGNEKKRAAVAAFVFGAKEAIEIMPDDSQGHDKGLARTGGHFETVLGPVVGSGIERQTHLEISGEAVKVVVAADLIDVNKPLNRLLLGAPEAEFAAVLEPVLLETRIREGAGSPSWRPRISFHAR